MGFVIGGVNEEDGRLISRLSDRPDQVFGKWFAGYLVFLATGHDRVQLDAVVDCFDELNALTGSDVAFAVFASEVKIRCKAQKPPSSDDVVGPVPLDRVKRFGRGRVAFEHGLGLRPTRGYVELQAICDATYKVAGSFGVLNELPCILAIDGLPGSNCTVVGFTEQLANQLVLLMRRAVHRLRGGRAPEATARLKELGAAWTECRACFDTAEARLACSDADGLLRPVHEAVARGKRNALDDIGWPSLLVGAARDALNRGLAASRQRYAEVQELLVALRHTILSLDRLGTEEWPLTAQTQQRLDAITPHLLRLSPCSAVPADRVGCARCAAKLQAQEVALVAQVIQPIQEAVATVAEPARIELLAAKESLAKADEALAAFRNSTDVPGETWSAVFQSEAQRLGHQASMRALAQNLLCWVNGVVPEVVAAMLAACQGP